MKTELIGEKELLGKSLKVDEVKYRYEKFDGNMSDPATKIIVKRSDAVAAIVYNTDTKQYIFARQFRAATIGQGSGWLTEAMAGVIDDGETAEKALAREMQEELGYTPLKTEKIASFYTAPGYATEQVHLYYVQVNNSSKTSQGGGLAEENENIQSICHTLDEIKALIASGSFNDAKTLIGCEYILRNQKV